MVDKTINCWLLVVGVGAESSGQCRVECPRRHTVGKGLQQEGKSQACNCTKWNTEENLAVISYYIDLLGYFVAVPRQYHDGSSLSGV